MKPYIAAIPLILYFNSQALSTELGTFFPIQDDDKSTGVETITCGDLINTKEENLLLPTFVAIWINGYATGADKTVPPYNSKFLSSVLVHLYEKCSDNGGKKILDAIKEITGIEIHNN